MYIVLSEVTYVALYCKGYKF